MAFLDPAGRESAALFEDVAPRYRGELSFGSVVDAGVAEAQGLEVPGVVCYKLVDGAVVVLKGFEGGEGWRNGMYGWG